jgi:hypothetical protein
MTSNETDPHGMDSPGNVERDLFVQRALDQQGDHYILGASSHGSDPRQFDCSSLVQWAAREAGITLDRTAQDQYVQLKGQNATVSVEEALRTKGALLFSFSEEPTAKGTVLRHAHVAISLGDGRTMEAMGTSYGVKVASATGRFQYGAVIPAFRDLPDQALGRNRSLFETAELPPPGAGASPPPVSPSVVAPATTTAAPPLPATAAGSAPAVAASPAAGSRALPDPEPSNRTGPVPDPAPPAGRSAATAAPPAPPALEPLEPLEPLAKPAVADLARPAPPDLTPLGRDGGRSAAPANPDLFARTDPRGTLPIDPDPGTGHSEAIGTAASSRPGTPSLASLQTGAIRLDPRLLGTRSLPPLPGVPEPAGGAALHESVARAPAPSLPQPSIAPGEPAWARPGSAGVHEVLTTDLDAEHHGGGLHDLHDAVGRLHDLHEGAGGLHEVHVDDHLHHH